VDKALIERIVTLAVEIQQIPGPTFSEASRAQLVCAGFEREGLADISQDPLGNVYARLPGAGLARPLVVSAHTDTVFPIGSDLKVRREADKIFGPSIGDNSLGVAGLFGLLWALRDRANGKSRRSARKRLSAYQPSRPQREAGKVPDGSRLPGDVWLVANVGEEGLGDLRGMRAVVDRFGEQPLAYLVLEGMALGQIYHRGLGVKRYRLTVRTPGGHSWVDFGRPSAIHELAELTTRLAALALPAQPRTSLNVGVISGGTSVNTIAAEAHLELDLRSEGDKTLAWLAAQVEGLANGATHPDVTVAAEVIGERPVGQIPKEHPLVRLAMRSLEKQGIQPCLNVGSTDANVPLSRGLPAICIGLTSGFGAHTTEEFIHLPPLEQGIRQLLGIVEGVWSALG
jgi:acetylornithine deacetylase/succinyl-diaminopimelate desuccinylase-like protein